MHLRRRAPVVDREDDGGQDMVISTVHTRTQAIYTYRRRESTMKSEFHRAGSIRSHESHGLRLKVNARASSRFFNQIIPDASAPARGTPSRKTKVFRLALRNLSS